MGLCLKSGFPRRLITVSLVVSVLLFFCPYEAQCASVPSVYNRSPFTYRRYDQTSLPISKEQFTNAFKEAIGDVRSSLKTHADNFDEFFRELLKVSHHNLHKMFKETYGFLYETNAIIFNDMFRSLELYYTNGSVDLTQSLRKFFSLLYKKMFEALNQQYAFDERYLNCTAEYMEEMMPFGELPQKLIHQIKRSFVAIRTFVQALKYGNEVLRTIMEVPFTSSCENRLRAMSYCRSPCAPAAPGTVLVCGETCAMLVDMTCFPYSASLNREWNIYLSDINKLASRLKTSFNIELAVKPINIQISEAIMTFQENGPQISQRLFTKCGKASPRLTTTQRPSRDMYHHRHLLDRPRSHTTTSQPPSPKSMEEVLADILKDLKNYRNLWSQMSRRLCSHYSNVRSNCTSQISRSGEPIDYRDKNNVEIINQQVSTLKLISTNIDNAYNGLDADLESNLKQIEIGNRSTPVDDDIYGSGKDDANEDDEDDDDDGGGSGSGREPITEGPRVMESTVSSSTTTNGIVFVTSSIVGPGSSTTKAPDHYPPQKGQTPSAAPRLTATLWQPLILSLFSSLLWRQLPHIHFVLL